MKSRLLLPLFMALAGLHCGTVQAEGRYDLFMEKAAEIQSVLLCRMEKEGVGGPASSGCTAYCDSHFAVEKTFKGPAPEHIRGTYVLPSWLPEKKEPPLHVGDKAIILGSFNQGKFGAYDTARATPDNLRRIEALLGGKGGRDPKASLDPALMLRPGVSKSEWWMKVRECLDDASRSAEHVQLSLVLLEMKDLWVVVHPRDGERRGALEILAHEIKSSVQPLTTTTIDEDKLVASEALRAEVAKEVRTALAGDRSAQLADEKITAFMNSLEDEKTRLPEVRGIARVLEEMRGPAASRAGDTLKRYGFFLELGPTLLSDPRTSAAEKARFIRIIEAVIRTTKDDSKAAHQALSLLCDSDFAANSTDPAKVAEEWKQSKLYHFLTLPAVK